MNCPECNNHIRVSDIEDTIFRLVDGLIVGNVVCDDCDTTFTVKQVVAYIPLENPCRRKGEQSELKLIQS